MNLQEVKQIKVHRFAGYLQATRGWWWPISLAIITLLLFSNSLGSQFIWDDVGLIQQNYLIQNLDNLPYLFIVDLWAFAGEGVSHHFYRPVVSLSLLTDFYLWGFYLPGYHLTNLLFHILTVIVIYDLSTRLLGQKWPGWLSALLFAIHPIHTEAVSWVSGRADIICGFFFFLAWRLYLRHRQQERLLYWLGSIIIFFLALMSKEIALTFPLIIFLYNLVFVKASNKSDALPGRLGPALLETSPYVVAVIIYLTVRLLALGFIVSEQERSLLDSLNVSDMASMFLFSVEIAALYIRLLVLPFPLNANRLVADLVAEAGLAAWLSLLLVGGLLILSIAMARRAPIYTFAGLFFLATALPVTGWLGMGDFVNERVLYIPSFSVCILLASLGVMIWQRRRLWGGGFLSLIIIPWLILTYQRNAIWQDNLTFWSHTAAASPHSMLARNRLAQALWEQGHQETAIRQLEEVLELDPENTEAYNSLGLIYFSQEQYQEAVAYYQQATKLSPADPWLYFNLGLAQARLGQQAAARQSFQQVLTIDEQFAPVYYQLSELSYATGDLEEAIAALRQVLELEPYSAVAHNKLGLVYMEQERFPEAIFAFEQAIQLDPNAVEIWNNLGLAQLEAGRLDTAIRSFEQAEQLDPDFAPAHFNLGLAYLEVDNTDKALQHLSKVVELDPTNQEAKRLLENVINNK